MSRSTSKILVLLGAIAIVLYIYNRSNHRVSPFSPLCHNVTNQFSRKTSIFNSNGDVFEYDRRSSVIFIGGVERSGLNLLRDIVQAHPGIRCHDETVILPKVLQMRQQWFKNKKEATRLSEAGMSTMVLDSAFSSLTLEVLARIDVPSQRLCNKDPVILKYGNYLKQLFPESKFLLMIRDPRSTIDSFVRNDIALPGYDLKSYRTSFTQWNNDTATMLAQCDELGSSSCLPVLFEKLVLEPRTWIPKIVEFLGIPSSKSMDQLIVRPVSPASLASWVDRIPQDVLQDLESLAPVMKRLGYDP